MKSRGAWPWKICMHPLQCCRPGRQAPRRGAGPLPATGSGCAQRCAAQRRLDRSHVALVLAPQRGVDVAGRRVYPLWSVDGLPPVAQCLACTRDGRGEEADHRDTMESPPRRCEVCAELSVLDPFRFPSKSRFSLCTTRPARRRPPRPALDPRPLPGRTPAAPRQSAACHRPAPSPQWHSFWLQRRRTAPG